MDLIPICTAQEIKEIDKQTIAGDFKKGFALMQQACNSLIDIVIEDSKNFSPVAYFIFAGKGNNGGDGMLLASYLLDQGYTAIAFIFAKPDELQAEAALAYQELQKRDPNKTSHRFISSEIELHYCTDAMNRTIGINYVIDAILGVGSKDAPKGFIAQAIAQVSQNIFQNRQRTRVLAVDVPSGVDPSNGEVFSPNIPADITVSIGFPKLGCYFYPGKAFFSNTIVKSLDYDPNIVQKNLKESIFFPTTSFYKKSLPQRIINGSKFDHGVVLNFSGSPGMTGAAVLSGYAAYKSGVGLVKIISEIESSKIIATKLTEAIYFGCNNSPKDFINASTKLLKAKHHAICVGPGFGDDKKDLIDHLLKNTNAPIILDADALNTYAGKAKLLKKHRGEILLTPHRGEYQRLFPGDLNDKSKPLDVIHSVKKRAKELNAIILFKGNPSFIVDTYARVFLIPYGNSALATAGSGDVLTGLITGFAAQLNLRTSNTKPDISILTQAAVLGAFVHARAGELASIELTEYSTLATDIANYIPLVIKELINP